MYFKKIIDDTIIWPEEKLSEESIWKYKIRFSTKYIVKDWKMGIYVPNNIVLNQGRKKISEKDFLFLIKIAEKKWKVEINFEKNLVL